MYSIVEKPAVNEYSHWFGAEIILVPVFCHLPDGREVFLLNKVAGTTDEEKKGDFYIEKKDDFYISLQIKQDKRTLDNYVEQLRNHDGKWIDRNSTWGPQPEAVKGLSPLEFIALVRDNGFTFKKECTDIAIYSNGTARFSGNLKQYSCAFSFDIFDKEMIEEIKKEAPEVECRVVADSEKS